MLATRLWLWDNVFDFARVARSDKEERSREHIWTYINYCHSINEIELCDLVQLEYSKSACEFLSDYAARLEIIPLTPIQGHLRERLKRIGKRDIAEIIFDLHDGSHIPFLFDPTGKAGEHPQRQIKREEELKVDQFQDDQPNQQHLEEN